MEKYLMAMLDLMCKEPTLILVDLKCFSLTFKVDCH